MQPSADMILVSWTFSGPCHRWFRRTVQRLALDSVVHDLHRVGHHGARHVHVGDL
jgi:hypothetical protein